MLSRIECLLPTPEVPSSIPIHPRTVIYCTEKMFNREKDSTNDCSFKTQWIETSIQSSFEIEV